MEKIGTISVAFCKKCNCETSHRLEFRAERNSFRNRCRLCEMSYRKQISDEVRERKRARDRKRGKDPSVIPAIRENRRRYGSRNKERLRHAAREKALLNAKGRVCKIEIVKCRECNVLEIKRANKVRQGKATAVYCSAHARKYSRASEFVNHRPRIFNCIDCGCETSGNARGKWCRPCYRRHNRHQQMAKPHVRESKRDRGGSHRKRARINGGLWETVDKHVVFSRDNHKCCQCGVKVLRSKEWRPDQATIDHIVPLSKGGSHTYANTRTLCTMCNSKKCDTMPFNHQLTIFDRVTV